MEFSTEWKSLWPISSTPSAPLHIPNKNSETHFGPVIFTPKPNSSTTLLHSPSFSPSLPPQYQQLSLSRFLQNYDCIPSSANSISSLLGPELPNYSSCFHSFNSLQLLQIPNKDSIIAFFPTGENFDEVGFSLLSVKEGILSVQAHQGNSFQKVKEGNVNHQRITRLLVNPVVDVCCDDHVAATVGLLMVCTIYSVCWYRIEISTSHIVCLDYLGGANAKMLKGNAVVCACWSPHLNEECLVLLENGDLLLFDVSYPYGGKVKPMSLASDNSRLVNKKMHLSLTDKMGLEKQESDNGGRRWFFCEFSWHPRIFIVSHCNAVFLVDLRYARKCYIGCLLKLEMLSIGKNDEFYALSKAGNDGFTFTVSTRHLLLLCDVRKPLMPVLRWTHGIENPQYMTVLRLSELRANAQDTRYELASEAGYCIILGSFWDNDFSLFCYGPYGKGNGPIRAAEISYYAWGLPSKLSLSGSNCNCANCLVREEFLKASLPSWVDWRQKKPLVLGFSILEPSLSAQLCSPNDFGSFMVLKLMSSGNLEAQAYISGWESENISEADHNGKNIYSEDNLSYNSKYSEYDGGKRFQHLELEFLYAYMEDKLAEHIVKRREKKQESTEASQQNCSVRSESNVHQEVCHRLKDFGLPRVRPSLEVSTVLKDIRLPTSIHEIALRSMCVGLPTNLLQLASPAYSDLDKNTEKEPLGFVDVSDQHQPPFFTFRKPSYCSNKWSSKVRPSDAFEGLILSPHFLATLHKICMEERTEEESKAFSTHSQFKLQCDRVMEVVQEHVSAPDAKIDDDFVSLAQDSEDMSCETQKLRFSYHKPSAFSENPSSVGLSKPGCDNDIFSTHVFRRNQEHAADLREDMVGSELFDVGCPIELKFSENNIKFGPKELEAFRKLKKQDLDSQRSFKPYQDYIRELGRERK